MNALSRYADTVYCIARLIIGLLFACHGGQKILNFPPGGHGMPPGAMGMISAWVELAGGLCIALGLFTRIAAFLAAGEMAVAYFMVHAKMGAFPIVNKGEPAVFYCWFFLFVLFYGPGRWAFDSLLFRRTAPAAGSSTLPAT